MRNRSLQPRVWLRLIGGQQQAQQQTSSAATSAAAADASTSATTSSASTSSSSSPARLSRSASLTRRRLAASGAQGTLPSSSAASSSFTRRRRSISKQRSSPSDNMMLVNRGSLPGLHSMLRRSSLLESILGLGADTPLYQVHGINHVAPPPTSFKTVALQNFFAAQRPLLEHSVVDIGSASGRYAAQSDEQDADHLELMKNDILQHLHNEGHVSSADLKSAKVVFAGPVGGQSHATRVDKIEQTRFESLLDRLSSPKSPSDVVRQEEKRLREERDQRENIDAAVNSAVERGEDPSVAESLGSEAFVVILGEPDGPNPAWARGVATHMSESARAFEAPPAPSSEGHSVAVRKERSYEEREEGEDDSTLLLNHALVQAKLPPALSWDRLVAQMNAATLSEDAASTAVDVRLLNSEVRASDGGAVVADDVAMDSTKRKRKKKMNKHKYQKLRKRTRVERRRLKQ